MSLSGTYSVTVSACGVNVIGQATTTGVVGISPIDDTLAVGSQGELTTRTDDDTGVVTTDAAGHGIEVADYVDVHWSGGSRAHMEVTNVSDTAITVDGGSGDNLPVGPDGSTSGTTVVIQDPEAFDCTFDGDNLRLIGFGGARQSRWTFVDASNNVLLSSHVEASAAYGWSTDFGTSTPITGNAVKYVYVSNGSATLTNAVKLTGLQYAS